MIVVAGEALVDVVVDAEGDSGESPGGSPLNVAVGLARLAVPATLVTQLGHDERGGQVVQHLSSSGVEVVAVPTATGLTSVAVARLDADGAARYEFELEWSLPRQELPPCRALHVGSLGTLLEPGRDSVLDLVDQAWDREVFVSYDANLRESFVEDRDRVLHQVRELAARCSLVKLSDEDAGLLDPHTPPEEVARSLLAGERTQVVLLTLGARGAAAWTAQGETRARSRPVEVVDTVGAGDAFMAGTLAQLSDLDAFRSPGTDLGEDDVTRLLHGAMEVAALTCERRGANPPRRQELPPGWPG
jgi:fructokinase